MRDLSLPSTPEGTYESPIRVSPQAFDALSHILGRTIAQGMQQHTAGLPTNLRETKRGKLSGAPESVCTLPYEWAAGHLLAKMRVEAS
jgi:hypothetical protein